MRGKCFAVPVHESFDRPASVQFEGGEEWGRRWGRAYGGTGTHLWRLTGRKDAPRHAAFGAAGPVRPRESASDLFCSLRA